MRPLNIHKLVKFSNYINLAKVIWRKIYSVGKYRPTTKRLTLGQWKIIRLNKPPIWVSDYYEYCFAGLQMVAKSSNSANKIALLFAGIGKIPSIPKSYNSVLIQVEHTLVLPGGRDSFGSAQGEIEGPYGENYLVRLIGEKNSYIEAKSVIDYSEANIFNVDQSKKKLGYLPKFFYIAPLLGNYNREISPRANPTIITVMNSPDKGRRGEIMDSLRKQKVEVTNHLGQYENPYQIYKNNAILLNLHQTDQHHTLEELRILPALLQGCLVISESFPLSNSISASKFIISCETEELAKTIIEVQENYTKWWKEIFINRDFVSFLDQIEHQNDENFRLIFNN